MAIIAFLKGVVMSDVAIVNTTTVKYGEFDMEIQSVLPRL